MLRAGGGARRRCARRRGADGRLLPPGKALSPPAAWLTSKLKRRVNFAGFSDRGLTLARAQSALYQRYGLVFELDLGAFREASFPSESIIERPVILGPIPPMRDVPLAAVLSAVLARIPSGSGATFLIRRDVIELTTRRRAAVEGWKGMGYLAEEYARYPVCSNLADVPFCARRLCRFLSEFGYWHGIMVRYAKEVREEAMARQAQARAGQSGQPLLTGQPLKEDPKDEELRKLLKERYNEARSEAEVLHKLYSAARCELDSLLDAQQRMVKAGLELCDKPADKVALLTRYVELTKETEKIAQRLYRAGRGSPAANHRARHQCLDAKIQLLRAKREADKAKGK